MPHGDCLQALANIYYTYFNFTIKWSQSKRLSYFIDQISLSFFCRDDAKESGHPQEEFTFGSPVQNDLSTTRL